MTKTTRYLLLMASMLAACVPARYEEKIPVDGHAILEHTKKLAADEMEGRAPGSKGEELATGYIERYFKALGLSTTMQPVPLVGITSKSSDLKLTRGVQSRTFKRLDQFIAWSKRQESPVAVSAELVFAGYGVVAPEYEWNDFKGMDLKGKILVVLINDPQVEDTRMFGGKAMTYYGRWTYKFEEAARQGAAGALIIHETPMAGYPWEVVRGSWSGEQFDLQAPDNGASTVPLQGWITTDSATEIFKWASLDLAELRKKALSKDFTPVPLGIQASAGIQNTLRQIDSKNVIGVLEGEVKEYIVYTSHWDHFGIGEEQNGDKIYNGAVDNASGVAMLLEMARVFSKTPSKPKRSIVFIAVTAEEQGLLGSRYYAEHPVFPLNKTLANINIDEANVFGPNKEITVIGAGANTLEDLLQTEAARAGRTIVPEAEPEKGFYYRSDQFSFAKQGVPALYIDSKPLEPVRKFEAERYHKPQDEVQESWNMDGAVADAELLIAVGRAVASAGKWPEWRPGNEFRSIREKSLGGM